MMCAARWKRSAARRQPGCNDYSIERFDLTTVTDLVVEHIAQLSFEDYRKSVFAQVRGLLLGHFDQFTFIDGMLSAMERGFERAWQEGASECGIGPDERTVEENDALNTMIFAQAAFLPGFAAEITATRSQLLEAGSGLVFGGALLSRATMWANRYNDVRNQAHTLACQDSKMEWVLGPTEHCSSCSRLAGKVKRGSAWARSGVRPQSRELECGGFNCQCRLQETNAPATPGPLPRLP
jgi:hypothetical protein